MNYQYIDRTNLSHIRAKLSSFLILNTPDGHIKEKDGFIWCGEYPIDLKDKELSAKKRYEIISKKFKNTPKLIKLPEKFDDTKYFFISDNEIFLLHQSNTIDLFYNGNTLCYIYNGKITPINVYFFWEHKGSKKDKNGTYEIKPIFENNLLQKIVFQYISPSTKISYDKTFYNALFSTIAPLTPEDFTKAPEYFNVGSEIKTQSSFQAYSRFIRNEVMNMLPNSTNYLEILDIGAGRGGSYNSLAKKYKMKHLVAMEPDLTALMEYQTRVPYSKFLYFIHSPFDSELDLGSFNIIMSHFAIHYFTTTQEEMEQLKKFIKKSLISGGYFIFTVMTKTKILKNKLLLLENMPNPDWDIKIGEKDINVKINSFSDKYIPEVMFDDQLFRKIFHEANIEEISLEKKFDAPVHVKTWFSCYSLFIIK
jgi:ubiquinone/menaquinone biosynthesis C-methylase UbiE